MRCAAALLLLALSLPHAATAEPVKVDMHLIAAADISESMTPDIGRLQRQGYAAALRSDQLAQAIRFGQTGRIGFAYIEWGDVGRVEILVPWTVVASPADARAVAERLERAPERMLQKTSISHGLAFSAAYFDESGMAGDRVIDVSGNGPNNNQGSRVSQARDRLVAEGITINGLPIMTETDTPRGVFDTGFDLRELDLYYRDCVVGGPGAFVLPVSTQEELISAIRLKLVLEISRTPVPAPLPAQFRQPAQRFASC